MSVVNVKTLEEFCLNSDATKSYYITSQVPEICKTEPCIFGIDEAGRGPVLGPMVYGISYCPKDQEQLLKDTGCADSKSLTEAKRENIFDKICSADSIAWEVNVISPVEISNCMLRRQKYSLNEISHNAAITLLKRALERGANITEVFVDTVGPAEKYQEKLKNIFPELEITVRSKADSLFPIVGGASICAKVVRDTCLKVWKYPELDRMENIACGSGYPGDPDTKKFLTKYMDECFGFSSVVRFSWSTASKILEDNAITVEWEEEEELQKGSRSVKAFFKPTNKIEKHKYFSERCLTNCNDL